MFLDVRTLIFSNLLLSAFLAVAMLFYRLNQRTYPGFGLWVAGIFSFVASYLAMIVRDATPLWLSIVLVNFSALLGFMLWLDGVLLFMKEYRLDRHFYAAPFAVVILLLYFNLVHDSIVIRNLILSACLISASWAMGAALLSRGSVNESRLARGIGVLCILEGFLLIARATMWLASPGQGLLGPGLFHVFYFAGVLLLNVGIVTGFLMLNSRRIETDLIASREGLDEALMHLRASISEIKTLSGLLPICSHCKRIRDDRGDWQQMELYIRERSEADFSHGICPDCLKKHYPDFVSGP